MKIAKEDITKLVGPLQLCADQETSSEVTI